MLDVFEIDAAFARHHDPDVVLLLEVPEHVDDPAGVLRATAAAVRPDTTILFTVPLHGRLDGVWGHASTFGRGRLMRICREAGLIIERAEPVYSTWSLVVARTTGPPREGRRSRAGAERRADPAYAFWPVSVIDSADSYRRPSDGRNVEIKPSRAYLRCVIRPRNGHPRDGVRLEMANPSVARLELSVDPPDRVRSLLIQGLDEHGRPRLEWATQPGASREIGRRATYVLKPGGRARHLSPTAPRILTACAGSTSRSSL